MCKAPWCDLEACVLLCVGGLIVVNPAKAIFGKAILSMSWPQVAARGVGFDSGKPRDKLFLGKLFHPCLGHKWRKGGWGSGSQLGSGRDGWGWRVKDLCELCYVWGLIVENQRKAIFEKAIPSMSWPQVVARGWGFGVRGLTLQNEEQSYFRESYSIHVLATSGGKWVGVGLTTGLQGRWVGWADEKPYVQLMCNSTWCDLEACVRLGDLVRL